MPEQPPARHRGEGRARRSVDWWPCLGSLAVVLWAWVAYLAAELELPVAVVAATVITAAAAYTVGHLIGERR